MSMSLNEFGQRVGCDYTTASRLLSGDRAPSTALLGRICQEFGLDGGDALRVLNEDRSSGRADGKTPGFADWLRSQVFDGSLPPDVPRDPLDRASTNR